MSLMIYWLLFFAGGPGVPIFPTSATVTFAGSGPAEHGQVFTHVGHCSLRHLGSIQSGIDDEVDLYCWQDPPDVAPIPATSKPMGAYPGLCPDSGREDSEYGLTTNAAGKWGCVHEEHCEDGDRIYLRSRDGRGHCLKFPGAAVPPFANVGTHIGLNESVVGVGGDPSRQILHDWIKERCVAKPSAYEGDLMLVCHDDRDKVWP